MERALGTLLQRVDPARFRHALVTLRKAGEFCRTLPADVRVHELNALGADRFSFLRLARVLHKWKPAIVHARGVGCWWDTILASALAGRVPAILGFHGLETGNGFSTNQRRAARWARWRGATFTSVSRAGIEVMKDALRIPREAIQHLPNGVDTSRFSPPRDDQRDRARRALRIPPLATVVGTVASLTPIKRHDLMIDALKEGRRSAGDVRLLVVGSGPLRAKLAEQARRRGVEAKVIFAGHREDVTLGYHAMDAYVCASDSEGVSNSVLEAMSCGVPVITTNVGDHGILVRDGVEGVVVPAGSVAALVRGMHRVLCSPVSRNKMGCSSRLRVCSMTLEDMLARYQQLYEQIAFAAPATASRIAVAG